jgi:hypothetical protein
MRDACLRRKFPAAAHRLPSCQPFNLFVPGVTAEHDTGAPVRPDNPNQLKLLTFTSGMITLERCGFPYLFTFCNQVSDHAICRSHPARIHRHLMSVTSPHEDRIHHF